MFENLSVQISGKGESGNNQLVSHFPYGTLAILLDLLDLNTLMEACMMSIASYHGHAGFSKRPHAGPLGT